MCGWLILTSSLSDTGVSLDSPHGVGAHARFAPSFVKSNFINRLGGSQWVSVEW